MGLTRKTENELKWILLEGKEWKSQVNVNLSEPPDDEVPIDVLTEAYAIPGRGVILRHVAKIQGAPTGTLSEHIAMQVHEVGQAYLKQSGGEVRLFYDGKRWGTYQEESNP